MMAGHQPRSSRYPNLRVTVKHETDERSVKEIYAKPRTYNSKSNYHQSTYYHPTTIYYNSNHRQKQNSNQYRSKKSDHFQQPIRPLMEIKDNQYSRYYETNNYSYIFREKELLKKYDQYSNRKIELDWDHGFDLEQIDLYTTQNDIDNYSLASMNSSSDNSFSSV